MCVCVCVCAEFISRSSESASPKEKWKVGRFTLYTYISLLFTFTQKIFAASGIIWL